MGMFRLILAFMVVASHTPGYATLFGTVDIGWVAVAAFFFISGFLMPLTYEVHYEKSEFLSNSLKFYLNRILRIFPIYWFSLLLTLGLYVGSLLMTRSRGGTLDPALLDGFVYLQNFLLIGLNQSFLWGSYFRFNNPAWTLDVELQYYAIVPVLILALRCRKKVVLLFSVVFSFISFYLLCNPIGVVDVDRSLVAWSLFFLMGFWYYKVQKVQLFISKRLNVTGCVIVLLIVLSGFWYESVINMGLALILIIVSSYILPMQAKYRFGAKDKLAGDLSYPVYILHIPVMIIIAIFWKYSSMGGLLSEYVIVRFLQEFLVTAAASVVMGYAVLRVISDPIDRLRIAIRDRKYAV